MSHTLGFARHLVLATYLNLLFHPTALSSIDQHCTGCLGSLWWAEKRSEMVYFRCIVTSQDGGQFGVSLLWCWLGRKFWTWSLGIYLPAGLDEPLTASGLGKPRCLVRKAGGHSVTGLFQ